MIIWVNYIASTVIKKMVKKGIDTANSRILVMGLTFKENCPDLRNTKVTDIISEFAEYGITVDVYDPWVNLRGGHEEYQIKLVEHLQENTYSGIVIAVAHQQFAEMSIDQLRSLCKEKSVIYDVKRSFPLRSD